MKLEDVLTILTHKPDAQLDAVEFAMDVLLATDMNLVSCCCCCCCL